MEIPLGQVSPGVALVRPADPPGQLRILCTVADGQTIVDLGRPVRWFQLTSEQLGKLIEDLQYCLRTARMLHLG